MSSNPVIVFDAVSKRFGAHHVLNGISFAVEAKETVAILGGSGSGKSVTLKHVNGLLRPDSGAVTTLGVEVSARKEKELHEVRGRVSYLFQQGALFDSMTVFDNIAFPLVEHEADMDASAISERVTELLETVQLPGTESLYPAELSGGMRKRVALARALARRPEIILYDEPTTGLDPVTGEAIGDLILDLSSRYGVTSLVVTHDIPIVERVAERILFLSDGRFTYSGTIAAARSEGPEQLQRFFRAGRTTGGS
jgi:phospholipid/cholesterol/gamma-HCH transport system ATP-binding protein